MICQLAYPQGASESLFPGRLRCLLFAGGIVLTLLFRAVRYALSFTCITGNPVGPFDSIRSAPVAAVFVTICSIAGFALIGPICTCGTSALNTVRISMVRSAWCGALFLLRRSLTLAVGSIFGTALPNA